MTRDHTIAERLMDALSIGVLLVTLADMLPSVAAILTIVWTAIRILETETIRSLFRRRGGEG